MIAVENYLEIPMFMLMQQKLSIISRIIGGFCVIGSSRSHAHCRLCLRFDDCRVEEESVTRFSRVLFVTCCNRVRGCNSRGIIAIEFCCPVWVWLTASKNLRQPATPDFIWRLIPITGKLRHGSSVLYPFFELTSITDHYCTARDGWKLLSFRANSIA